MQSLELPHTPTLKDFQEYVAMMYSQRGFEGQPLSALFMLLLEESGELAKAARKVAAIKTRDEQGHSELQHEAADVFIFLLEICNHLGIDLEKAFRDKEDINKQREWK